MQKRIGVGCVGVQARVYSTREAHAWSALNPNIGRLGVTSSKLDRTERSELLLTREMPAVNLQMGRITLEY